MSTGPDIPTTDPASGTSLLGLAQELTSDDDAKAEFREDPEGFLADRGLDELGADELATAWGHVADALPAPLAVAFFDAANVGGDVVDQLLGIVEIDPLDADATWTALTAIEDDADLDNAPDGDAPDGEAALDDSADEDADLPGGLDPVDLDRDPDTDPDEEPGGLDPVGLDEPGGLDPVRSARSVRSASASNDDDSDKRFTRADDEDGEAGDDAFGSGSRATAGDDRAGDDGDLDRPGKDFDQDDLEKRFDDIDDDLGALHDIDGSEQAGAFESDDDADRDDPSGRPDDDLDV